MSREYEKTVIACFVGDRTTGKYAGIYKGTDRAADRRGPDRDAAEETAVHAYLLDLYASYGLFRRMRTGCQSVGINIC